MSRAVDLLLVLLVGLAAWLLLRSRSAEDPGPAGLREIRARVSVSGDVPLDGLGLLLEPWGGVEPPAGDEPLPHQLEPFSAERTTRIVVPVAGTYRVWWGLQDQGAPPALPRDVSTAPSHDGPEVGSRTAQAIQVGDVHLVDSIEIELQPATAAALRAHSQD